MGFDQPGVSRREFLVWSSLAGISAVGRGSLAQLQVQGLSPLEAAFAGSMKSLMDGPIKSAAARTLHLDLRGHSQGANAVADAIVAGTLTPDIFLPVTAGPMLTVMHAGKAETAEPVGRTELVIVYSPKSRFAPRFAAAAQGKEDWWKILQEPGLRFGRSNPAGDPGGRSILFTMMLAARKYKQPDLVDKVLGETINHNQIFTGGKNVTDRLLDGDLDAASAYKIGPMISGLPFIPLPKEINLSSDQVRSDNPDVSLTIDGQIYHPEPLVYYAAVLKDAVNAKSAASFLHWLMGDEAQAIFRNAAYDPPGLAPVLHA